MESRRTRAPRSVRVGFGRHRSSNQPYRAAGAAATSFRGRAAEAVARRDPDPARAQAASAVDRLVQGLGPAEPDLAVEPDGGVVPGGDLQVRPMEARLVEPASARRTSARPSPIPRYDGITPTFWIAPIGPMIPHPLDGPDIAPGQAIIQVASGRKPGFRRISLISRRQP